MRRPARTPAVRRATSAWPGLITEEIERHEARIDALSVVYKLMKAAP